MEEIAVTRTEKRVKFFQHISTLISTLQNEGIHMMPFSFHRDFDTQLMLYKKGRTKTLRSKHLYWLAIDLVLVKDGKLVWRRCPEYERAGKIWKDMGHRWGGDWKRLNDIYHFEW